MADERDPLESRPEHGQYVPESADAPFIDEQELLLANRETALGPLDRNRDTRSEILEDE
jgi:hypothetical protein